MFVVQESTKGRKEQSKNRNVFARRDEYSRVKFVIVCLSIGSIKIIFDDNDDNGEYRII